VRDLTRPVFDGRSYSLVGPAGAMALRNADRTAEVAVSVVDEPMLKTWVSGSPVSTEEEAVIGYYVGRLHEREEFDPPMKEADVKQEGPLVPPPLRSTVADVKRYNELRDALVETINDNSSIVDTVDLTELAEALLTKFNIELPNN
jgi:hypothetical protein